VETRGRPSTAVMKSGSIEGGSGTSGASEAGEGPEPRGAGSAIRSSPTNTATAMPGDRDVVRPGPFPAVRWTAELDFAGRWAWRRVEDARGTDVGRPDWATVFVESSIACGER